MSIEEVLLGEQTAAQFALEAFLIVRNVHAGDVIAQTNTVLKTFTTGRTSEIRMDMVVESGDNG